MLLQRRVAGKGVVEGRQYFEIKPVAGTRLGTDGEGILKKKRQKTRPKKEKN